MNFLRKVWNRLNSKNVEQIYCLDHFEEPIDLTYKFEYKFNYFQFKNKKVFILARLTRCKNCEITWETKVTCKNFDKKLNSENLVNELLPIINNHWKISSAEKQKFIEKFSSTGKVLPIPSAPPAYSLLKL